MSSPVTAKAVPPPQEGDETKLQVKKYQKNKSHGRKLGIKIEVTICESKIYTSFFLPPRRKVSKFKLCLC